MTETRISIENDQHRAMPRLQASVRAAARSLSRRQITRASPSRAVAPGRNAAQRARAGVAPALRHADRAAAGVRRSSRRRLGAARCAGRVSRSGAAAFSRVSPALRAELEAAAAAVELIERGQYQARAHADAASLRLRRCSSAHRRRRSLRRMCLRCRWLLPCCPLRRRSKRRAAPTPKLLRWRLRRLRLRTMPPCAPRSVRLRARATRACTHAPCARMRTDGRRASTPQPRGVCNLASRAQRLAHSRRWPSALRRCCWRCKPT